MNVLMLRFTMTSIIHFMCNFHSQFLYLDFIEFQHHFFQQWQRLEYLLQEVDHHPKNLY